MSFCSVLSAAVIGLRVEFIHVEADVSNGLPVFHMVGYLSSEVKEAAERVRTAIRNSGVSFPAKRTIVNLAPANVRKRGASFDLPIAVAVMIALGRQGFQQTGWQCAGSTWCSADRSGGKKGGSETLHCTRSK